MEAMRWFMNSWQGAFLLCDCGLLSISCCQQIDEFMFVSRVFLGRFTACKSDFSDVGGLGATRQMVICCGIAADVAVPICTYLYFSLAGSGTIFVGPAQSVTVFFWKG
jgi:hypothetical protein